MTYVPDHFRVDHVGELHAFMERDPFATLISTVGGTPFATHLPFIVDREDEGIVLRAHMARANRQWRDLARQEVLVVFMGPHAYVSPNWYESRQSVPTWNYMAVHARGRGRILEDRDEMIDVLRRLTAVNEAGSTSPWSIDELPPPSVDAFVRAIVAFRIHVTRLDGAWKLSQNRPIRDREGLRDALSRIDVTFAAELAARMQAQIDDAAC